MNPRYTFYEKQLLSYYSIDSNFAKALKISDFHRQFLTSKDTLFKLARQYKKLGRQDLSIPILKKILVLDGNQVSSFELFYACFKIAKFSLQLKYIGLCSDMISLCHSYLKVLDRNIYISSSKNYEGRIKTMEEDMKKIINESKEKLDPNKSIALIDKGKKALLSKNSIFKEAENCLLNSLFYKYTEEAFIYLALCKMRKGDFNSSLLFSKLYLGLIPINEKIIEEDRLKASLIYIKSLIELGLYEMALEEISFFQHLSPPNSKYQESFDKYFNTCKYFLSIIENVILNLPKTKSNYTDITKELPFSLRLSPSEYKVNNQFYLISMKWVKLWEKHFYTRNDINNPSDSYFNNASPFISPIKEPSINNSSLDSQILFSIHKKNIIHNSLYKEKLQNINIEASGPGPIFNVDLLKYQHLFNDPLEKFTNINLKKGLEENIDFIVVSEDVWNKLYSYFGGVTIQRYLSNYFNPPILETYLFPIRWTIYNQLEIPEKCKFSQVFVRLISTSNDLLNKICRIINCNNLYSSTLTANQLILWRLKKHTNVKELFEIIKSKNIFSASIMKDTKFMKDKNVGRNERILVEIVPNGLSNLFQFSPRYINFTQNNSNIQLLNIKTQSNKQNIDINEIFRNENFKVQYIIEKRNNNCYINCIVDCLAHSTFLLNKIINLDIPKSLYLSNTLSLKGNLSLAVFKYIIDFWFGPIVDGKRGMQSFAIKKKLAEKYERLSKNETEDSLDFLHNLMNEIHEDFNKNFQTQDSIKIKANEIPKTSETYELLNNSFISEIFFGHCHQITTCINCSNTSEIFDHFISLNLSIPFRFKVKVYLLRDFTSKIESYSFYVGANAIINELTSIMNTKLNLENYQLKFVSIFERSIEFLYNSFTKCQIINTHKGILFAYLVPKDKIDFLEVFAFFNIQYKHIFSTNTLKSEFPRVLFVEKSRTNSSVQKELKKLIEIIIEKSNNILVIETKSKQNNHLNNKEKLNMRITCRVQSNIEINTKIPFPPAYCRFVPFQLFAESNNLISNIFDIQFSIQNQLKREKIYNYLNSEISMVTSNEEKIIIPLEKCLKRFQKIEKVDLNNLWDCSKCNKKVQIERQIKITKFPPNLIICLKRSFISIANKEIKNESIVNFPISNFRINQNNEGIKEEIIYKLYGIVNHMGKHQYGTYNSFCRNYAETWNLFDFPISKTIENPSSLNTPDAYLLFYTA